MPLGSSCDLSLDAFISARSVDWIDSFALDSNVPSDDEEAPNSLAPGASRFMVGVTFGFCIEFGCRNKSLMSPQLSQRHFLDPKASILRSASEKSNEPIARLDFVGIKAIRAKSAVLTLHEGCLNII